MPSAAQAKRAGIRASAEHPGYFRETTLGRLAEKRLVMAEKQQRIGHRQEIDSCD